MFQGVVARCVYSSWSAASTRSLRGLMRPNQTIGYMSFSNSKSGTGARNDSGLLLKNSSVIAIGSVSFQS